MTSRTFEFARYAVALLGFIGLGMLTKHFLTWTWGPVYFVTVLEVLPRGFRKLRTSFRAGTEPAEAAQ